jgi:uridine kinase
LFWRAFAELPIDRRRSVVIGDSLRDIGAARTLGLWAYGVRTGHGCRDGERYRRETGVPPAPDLMFEDVLEAVEFELSHGVLAERCAAEILHLLKNRNHPLLIGVCGRSRAGKTVLAHAITRVLTEQAIACLHVQLDHWIVPAAERAAKASAQGRNRVTALPDLVRSLQAGAIVRAPGYDALTRGAGNVVTYDPSGQRVIVLDGSFAGHESIRALLDLVVFVAVRSEVQQARFSAYYRWKGFEQKAIEGLWRDRTREEWPAVDAQRRGLDLIIGASDS